MVAAGITLCLDMLHRKEFDAEFTEHRHCVEKALHLLRRYDDSTLALRGVRLLSSLLTEVMSKQKPSKDRCNANQHSRSHDCEGDPPTWPENRHRIETLLAVDEPNSTADGPLSNASTAVSERADCHANIIVGITPVGGVGIDDNILRSTNDFDPMNAYGSLSKPNDSGLVSDLSWTDLFAEYFPAQSGFENAFLIENLFSWPEEQPRRY
jgi:hypothetical protein